MTYTSLEDYGVVGNLETAALVGRDGTIDWCCFPTVDSPSVFARILDDRRGGHWTVQPTASFESLQRYVDRTNVLETRFHTASGQATVTDFMPVPEVARTSTTPNGAIYRHVRCESGQVDLRVAFEPRFDYARTAPTVSRTRDGIVAKGDDETLSLSSSVPLAVSTRGARAAVTLTEGEDGWLVLGHDQAVPLDPAAHREVRDEVVRFWRDWAHECPDAGACPVDGPWHPVVVRSALALKLLINHETGAICAAPTTSLPEVVGGVRNWDYRYNWIRDAAFTVRALAELGHLEEARSYFDLCLDHCSRDDPANISPVYGLHGGPVPEERTLDHLSGHRDSSPVRVGNAAADQHQLDVYGELVLGIYETLQYGETIDEGDWDVMRDLIDYVADGWMEPDAGIWEVRADYRHVVYSKLMCWVALDRGLDVLERTDLDGPVERWAASRRAVAEAILERGYSETAGSFVRTFDDEDTLDATALLVPVVGFLSADDARVQSTIDAVMERLTTENGLVHRYEGDDGLPGDEGAFVICSFWLVTALARSGRVAEATRIFTDVLEFVTPLGLLSEEVDPETGALLGNYPQAFSHIGLVNGAIALARGDDDFDAVDGPLDDTDEADAGGPADHTNRSPNEREYP